MTPDDHYYPKTTSHHCHNLQHYLLNTTKYFTSNAQLFFPPGLHHLHTDLIIQNVHNISLIGSTTNGTTLDTVIQCNSSVGIVMANITNLIVTNITIRSCLGNEYNNTTVLIKQCTNVQLRHVVIEESHNSYGIVGINILGDSHFSYVTNNFLSVLFNDITVDMENHSLTIDHYNVNDVNVAFQQKVKLKLLQQNYRIKIQVLNSAFHLLKNDTAISIDFNNEGIGHNNLLVKHCQFANNNMPFIRSDVTNFACCKLQQDNGVWLQDCEFFNNKIFYAGIIHVLEGPNVQVSNCRFQNNINSLALNIKPHFSFVKFKIIITHTLFSSSISDIPVGALNIEIAELYLIGPVIFHNMQVRSALIRLFRTTVTFSNYIEFINISGNSIFRYTFKSESHDFFYISVKQSTIINVTNNTIETFAFLKELSHSSGIHAYNYPPCYFQYLPNKKSKFGKDSYGNYTITFDNNNEGMSTFACNNLPLTHCSWLPQSVFNTTMPLEVNRKYIKYINKSGTFDMLPQNIRQKTLCYCDTFNDYNCHKEMLDSIYPGQTMMLRIYTNVIDFNSFDTIVTVGNNITWLSPTACVITNSSEMVQISKTQACSELKYSIAFPKENWCELFLKGSRDGIIDKVDIYFIKEKPCPPGFTKIKGICQCYPFLGQFSINCNINDQAILRPGNFWILPIYKNSSYSYKVSLNCPFHYCLPHSSRLKFSTPNSQCQFNRSGKLCGH